MSTTTYRCTEGHETAGDLDAGTMTTTPKLRPSDLGYWHWNEAGTRASWIWRYKATELQIVQRAGFDSSNGTTLPQRGSTFTCRVVCDDPDSPFGRATLTVCGHVGKGGTRHMAHSCVGNAQANALDWMDRRYKVVPRAAETV